MPEEEFSPVDLNPAGEADELRVKLAAAEQDLANHKLQLAEYVNARKRLLQAAEVEKKYFVEPLVKDRFTPPKTSTRPWKARKKPGANAPLPSASPPPPSRSR